MLTCFENILLKYKLDLQEDLLALQKIYPNKEISIPNLNWSHYQDGLKFGVLTSRMYDILMEIATFLANIGAPVNWNFTGAVVK